MILYREAKTEKNNLNVFSKVTNSQQKGERICASVELHTPLCGHQDTNSLMRPLTLTLRKKQKKFTRMCLS